MPLLILLVSSIVSVGSFATLFARGDTAIFERLARLAGQASHTVAGPAGGSTVRRASSLASGAFDDLGEFGRTWGGSPLSRKSDQRGSEASQRRPTLERTVDGPLVIEAISHNGAWRFRYGDPSRGGTSRSGSAREFESFNSLRLPLGVDVRLLVTSLDNVCSFSVPELSLKRIAVPELVYSLDFRTDRGGVFRVEPDTLCGAGRLVDAAPGWVTIEDRAVYEQWFESRMGAGRGR